MYAAIYLNEKLVYVQSIDAFEFEYICKLKVLDTNEYTHTDTKIHSP